MLAAYRKKVIVTFINCNILSVIAGERAGGAESETGSIEAARPYDAYAQTESGAPLDAGLDQYVCAEEGTDQRVGGIPLKHLYLDPPLTF